ncbi:hypothetical protein ACIBJI_32745 [Nocardia sp. NPDC050408]|uniref:hypothetical protein n=1 Tax=Nocardia sp. NPDC050408 TaxID=3364319 RepID=UPI0037A35012
MEEVLELDLAGLCTIFLGWIGVPAGLILVITIVMFVLGWIDAAKKLRSGSAVVASGAQALLERSVPHTIWAFFLIVLSQGLFVATMYSASNMDDVFTILNDEDGSVSGPDGATVAARFLDSMLLSITRPDEWSTVSRWFFFVAVGLVVLVDALFVKDVELGQDISGMFGKLLFIPFFLCIICAAIVGFVGCGQVATNGGQPGGDDRGAYLATYGTITLLLFLIPFSSLISVAAANYLFAPRPEGSRR